MISKLDFTVIDTHDTKTLGLLDTSIYNPKIIIQDVKIEITTPGFKIPANPFFQPKSLNIFNSNNLGLTKASCEEELIALPDGLYKVRYSICPNDKLFIEKFFLRVDRLVCKFNKAFLSFDLSCYDEEMSKSKRKDLDNIEFFINGAIAAANDQDSKLASDAYKKASKLLDNFLNGNCNC